jgi:hypothetical protein
MLHDLREIPVIDPFATLLALYEMFGLVFRGYGESRSKISVGGDSRRHRSLGLAGRREPHPTHGEAIRRARVPPFCGTGPALFTARFTLALDFPVFFAS